jgi:MerR family mercuric resistance operon transcriptional regulator
MERVMARRIGDVAKAAGVGVETVRFYQRVGLVDEPAKPERGWREYDDAAFAQLGQVRLAQRMGLTLRDIKHVKARARGPKSAFCADVRETVAARLAAIEAEMAALNAKRVMLKRWLSQCRRRGETASCPLYEQITTLAPPAKGRRTP